MSELQTNRAILAALKGLQEKVQNLENERQHAIQEVQTLREELAGRQEDFKHTQALQHLTIDRDSAASRLSYEQLLADKRVVDSHVDETEEMKRKLHDACETSRIRAQDAQTAQLAAERKAFLLEGRIDVCEQEARARKERQSQLRKAARRETTTTNSTLRAFGDKLEILRQDLKDERTYRKSTTTEHQRVHGATYQTRRYLDSILQVNQELVAAVSRIPEPPTSPASKTRAPRVSQRAQSDRHGPSAPWSGAVAEGVDVGAAVEEAFLVGRAGGNPVPSLTALYERIGFCAMNGNGKNDGGIQSLPTSPRRRNCRKERGFQSKKQEIYRGGEEEPVADARFFPMEDDDMSGSPRGWVSGRYLEFEESGQVDGAGEHQGTGDAIEGYAFAHSPLARVTSAAERSPNVLKRLEALASQLEREKADVERWYKKLVHRASPGAQAYGRDSDLDARNLTKAIACLQEKAQQLEVVRESLKAFKAAPSTRTVASPTACRRKKAALHVLQVLCQDVVGGGKGGPREA